MNTDIFCPTWFQHFLRHTQPTANQPILLILDGHASHTKNILLIETARKNYVHILCIPPHTSHRVQPLDISFMFPLSTFYTQECELWLRNHPGRAITIRQVGHIFGKAYLRAQTAKNAISGFEKTGIWPFNPHIFPDEAFAASEVTGRLANENKDLTENKELTSDADDIPLIKLEETIKESNKENFPFCSKDVPDAIPFCSTKEIVEVIPNCYPTVEVEVTPLVRSISEKVPSGSNQMCSPRDIIPVPQVKQSNERKLSRKRGKTAVLTASPYLKELQEKNNVEPQKLVETVKRTVFENKNEEPQVTEDNKRKKLKHKKTDDDVDIICFLCGGEFLKSSSGEMWISCNLCKGWAHEECTAYESISYKAYVCDLCE